MLFIDKKGVDTRLQSAQSALLLHEDAIRRNDRERKAMIDQITALERQILALENEKKQFLVSYYLLSKILTYYISFFFSLSLLG